MGAQTNREVEAAVARWIQGWDDACYRRAPQRDDDCYGGGYQLRTALESGEEDPGWEGDWRLAGDMTSTGEAQMKIYENHRLARRWAVGARLRGDI